MTLLGHFNPRKQRWLGRCAFVGITWIGCASMAWAQMSPLGTWKTIEDGRDTALIRISEKEGVLSAKIEKMLPPGADQLKCDLCRDERKGQPLVGMTIMRNVRQNTKETGIWEGGDILDPDDGKVYQVRLKPIEEGRKLEVRGYVGMPAMGETEVWVRVQ